MAKAKRNTGCPIAYSLDVIGDKWSLIIIRDMLMRGKDTYGEFLAAEEGIATNILSDRLRHLCAEGIIEKRRDPDNKKRILYSLTEKGLDLAPLILDMVVWSYHHDANTRASRAMVERIENDRAGLLKELRQKGRARASQPRRS